MKVEARRHSDLVRVLVGRDLRVSYGNAVLGLLWAPLEAVLQVVVLSFLFVRVVPLDIPDYVAFVFAGVTLWQLMSGALVHGTEAFTANRDLVRRPGFPTPLLPIVAVGNALAGYLLTLPVLLVLIASTGRLQPSALTLPLVVAAAIGVVVGPTMVAATLHVRFRDVRLGVALITGILFFLTPVFYDVDRIPERYQWIAEINPFALLVELHREVLYDGSLPHAGRLATCYAIGLVGIAIAALVHRRSASHLADDL